MSRLNELKKQYPELNISVFDLITKLDSSKTYKYLPLMCKLFGRRLNPELIYSKEDYPKAILEIQSSLINKGISTNNLSEKEILSLHSITDFYNNDLFSTLRDFIYYMEQNQIENKDVTSYSSIDDMRGAITLASIKEFTKEMSNQVIKEYEDDTWIAVRPLTFTASAKYGAGTRWCTTYQKEKQYFERYWRQGILCYFINKKTGYKFAGFKSFQEKELSFWNAEDSRIDFLDVQIEDYMFSNVKKVFSSQMTNKNLCSDEIQEQVHNECIAAYELRAMVNEPQAIYRFENPVPNITIREDLVPQTEESIENREMIQEFIEFRTMTAVPMYEQPTLTRG